MPETEISSASESDITGIVKDEPVSSNTPDSASDSKETKWQDDEFYERFGYYTDPKTPEITAVIDARATWTVGKGFKAEPAAKFILDGIRGNGFDSFNTILENAMRTMLIGGNFYAEIIRDDSGNLINLKPLDPGVMSNIADKEGQIIRFEQSSKVKGKKPKTFARDKIFYLQRNRVLDEIHGRGIIQKLKLILDMKTEAMQDSRTINHQFAYPKWIVHLDSDDDTKIAAFKQKYDGINESGQPIIYVPKDIVVPELVAVAPNASISLLPWINYLDNQFYQTAGTPKIIVGGGSEFTEKASSIVYLAFQQNTEEDQLFFEEQVGLQLGLEINLEFPVSLENELLSDEKKDPDPTTVQPNETTAGAGQ